MPFECGYADQIHGNIGKKSTCKIGKSDNNLCLLRGIVVERVYEERGQSNASKYKKMGLNTEKTAGHQKQTAKELLREAIVTILAEVYGIEKITILKLINETGVMMLL